MPITGDKAWIARLRRSRNIAPAMDDWAENAAKDVVQTMQELIRDGGSPPPNHVVSSPGNPPNEEYGDLARDMRTEKLEGSHAVAIAYSDHALFLEMGTSRMAERPFARPATAINRTPLLIDARIRIDKHNRKR